ncbi:DUF4352 domain-containing protein [Actinomadura violacea]|uniref:DUF4352 domain-containing protein n=1 Tax=Actinomadura violacea TaxID=2819934 RepID=A0ABS3RV52_9ACTN|nr:DUF4352 domain-containing protein [Actinomadura violacea]MBO2460617.1 DUF4352 domain-containing protein [Actinomadura violacea]
MRIATMAAIACAAGLALTACDPAAGTTPETQTSAKAGAKTSGKPKAAKAVPIKLVAKRAVARKSVLSQGGALSCVKVTVTNQAKKPLEVNPLYFSITDTKGVKHTPDDAMGEYDGEIDTTTLAAREKAVGMVCGKGHFVPKVLAMTNPLFSEAARAEVA